MKRRLTAGVIVFAFLCVVSMYAAYNADQFLGGNAAGCSISPLVVLPGAWMGKAKSITLLLLLSSAGGVLFLTLMPEYIKYKSNMIQIVPGVETPEAAGQGQYGTAHWLPKSQIPKVFACAKIDKNSDLLRELLMHGYDDLNAADEKEQEPHV